MQTTVTLAHCPSYTADIEDAVDKLLAPLGGMQAFVNQGQHVLIKPNMLTSRTPEQAVTTHPEVVRAVIRSVKNAGGIPAVGDSPASAVKIEKILTETGFVNLCREENVPLIRFESSGAETFCRDGFSFNLATAVTEADVIINLPKVKTHVLTTLTAAVKNTYGAVPGYQKAMLHKKFTKMKDFGRLLDTIHRTVAPVLNIADGIVGMEGSGPSGGSPVNLNFLAASTSGVALDLELCHLLNINPRSVPFLPPNIPGPAPDTTLTDIKLNGRTVTPRKIKLPSTLGARMLPRWLGNVLDPFVWIRPAIDEKCIRCGRCVEACPADALSITNGNIPALAAKNCIGCCCCHEVCPVNAIEMTQSPLLNFIRKGRLP
jgi:uncharacterized protein (DUF362 family)/Pyruvate/2-oxoacid:ferredoxin oxidoreductase delta subunit